MEAYQDSRHPFLRGLRMRLAPLAGVHRHQRTRIVFLSIGPAQPAGGSGAGGNMPNNNNNNWENRPFNPQGSNGQSPDSSRENTPEGSHGFSGQGSGQNVQTQGSFDQNAQSRSARGTAAMDPQTRQEVARKGGLAVSRNRAHMAEIGRKGGQSVSKNREHMAQIGRKGGAASRGHRGSDDTGSSDSGDSNTGGLGGSTPA
jgi:general stress protein YciG